MANHKLLIDEFDEIDYELIAIHTTLEDFRLAYFVNKILKTNLNKTNQEIQINSKNGEAFFSSYKYDDLETNIQWSLIQNKSETSYEKKDINTSLFANTKLDLSTKVYFLPEFKKIDYFLKIDNAEDNLNIDKVIALLNSIKRIATVYPIDFDTIKNKNNLIF